MTQKNQLKGFLGLITSLSYRIHTPISRQKRVDSSKAPRGKESEKGISILIAIMSIAVMITFISEIIVSSTVNVELAIINRDKVRSEYLAKSGLNLGVYILTASYLWDHVQASGLLGAPQEPVDGPASLWTIINQLPPLGSQIVDFVQPLLSSSEEDGDPFGLQGFLNEKLANQMRLFQDQFSIKIEDESAKINVSDCVGSASAARACPAVIAQLEALFSCPAEKVFLESKNLSPGELAYRIRDFISSDNQASEQSNIGSKDEPYEAMTPAYKAKRLPFDSINELKMVKGWDDEIHTIFKPYLTIFPFKPKKSLRGNRKVTVGGININTAKPELLACLIPSSMKEGCREKSIQKIHSLKKEAGNIADGKGKVSGAIEDLFCYINQGTQLSQDNLADWFVVRSDVFNITVKASTGSQNRSISAVIRRVDSGVQGSDVEKREIKRAYQILYWRAS